MNIKTLVMMSFAFLMVMLSGCGKQKRSKKLGATHYKLALVELEDMQVENQRNYKKALVSLDEALSYESNGEYYALKATLLFLLGQEAEAHQVFHKALACSTDAKIKTEIQNNYACLLAQNGKSDQALAIWENLEKSKDYLSPEVALVNQAKCYLSCNNHEVAHEKLRQAIDCAPSYLDAHYYLALVEWHAFKDSNRALQSAETTLFLEPSHKGAQALLEIVKKEQHV